MIAAVLSLHCVAPQPPPIPAEAREVELGQLELARGENPAAVIAFRAALATNPEDATARRGLVRALLARADAGDGEAAAEEWRELAARGSDGARELGCQALELAARQALDLRRDEVAFAQLSDHEGLGCPPAPRRRLIAASFMTRAARFDAAGEEASAQRAWADARSADSSQPDAYLLPARQLLARGRVDPAVALLAKGLERHPHSAALVELMVAALGIWYPERALKPPPLIPEVGPTGREEPDAKGWE